MITGHTTSTVPAPEDRRRPYWAVLGADLGAVTSYSEALTEASLNWGLRTTQLDPSLIVHLEPETPSDEHPDSGEGGGLTAAAVTAPGRRLLIRDDTNVVLGMVGSRSQPVSNTDIFAVTDVLADRGARWVAGGAVDHGRTCFMLMRPRHSAITVTDAAGNTEQILVDVQIRTGHGGSESLSYELRATRSVRNTSIAVRANSSMFPGVDPVIRVRHTASASTRMQDAAAMIATAARYTDGFAKVARQLIATPMSAYQFGQVLDMLWPKPRPKVYGDFEDHIVPAARAKDDAAYERRIRNWAARRGAVIALFDNEPFAANSAYDAFVSVAHYLEWGRAARGRTMQQAAADRAFNDVARDDRSRLLSVLLNPKLRSTLN